MKTILVLTDFSIRAQYAAEFAMHIAIRVNANILLCNAMEIIESAPMAEQIAWPVADHLALKQDSLLDLKEIAKRLEILIKEAGDTPYQPTITCINEFGKLSAVVEKIIKEKDVNLIVMGSHKSTGFARFLFGCHTHHVLDSIDCPVLLVPESLTFTGLHAMAYATDLTFSDLKVINYLSKMAVPFNAEILVSHISLYGLEGIESEKIIQHSINELLAQNHPKVLYTSIKGDNIAKSLAEISGSGKADILVLVHKRYTFFERLFHLSVSKKMASTSKIPLLILPYSFSLDVADISDEQLDHYCYQPQQSR